MCYIEHRWSRYQYLNPNKRLELIEQVQDLAQYNTYDLIFDTPIAPKLPLEQISEELDSALQKSISHTHTPEPPVTDKAAESDSDKESDKMDTAI